MSSFMEASKTIWMEKNKNIEWIRSVSKKDLLELTNEWKINTPSKDILDDFKMNLNKKKPYEDNFLEEIIYSYNYRSIKKEEALELLDNLFFFGLDPLFEESKFQSYFRAKNLIDDLILLIGKYH